MSLHHHFLHDFEALAARPRRSADCAAPHLSSLAPQRNPTNKARSNLGWFLPQFEADFDPSALFHRIWADFDRILVCAPLPQPSWALIRTLRACSTRGGSRCRARVGCIGEVGMALQVPDLSNIGPLKNPRATVENPSSGCFAIAWEDARRTLK